MRRSAGLTLRLESSGILTPRLAVRYLGDVIQGGPPSCLPAVRVLLDKGYSVQEHHIAQWLLVASYRPALEPLVEAVLASRQCDSLRDKVVYAPTRDGGVKVFRWTPAFLEAAQWGDSAHRKWMYAIDGLTYGHVDWIKWIVRDQQVHASVYLYLGNDPSKAEVLALMELARELGLKHGLSDAEAAAKRGHLDVLTQLYIANQIFAWGPVVNYAAWSGHLHVLEWLHATGLGDWSTTTMDRAARGGHLHVVQWLHKNRHEGCSDAALADSAAGGHLRVVQWLTEHRPEGNTSAAMALAAQHLSWLYANRPGGCISCVLQTVLRSSAQSIASVRWLRRRVIPGHSCSSGCLLSSGYVTSVARVAAERGHLAMLQEMHQEDPEEITTRLQPLAESAKWRGHVGVLEWFRG